MLKKQRGNVIFWVLSAVLAIALALILLLSGKYNLDPEKNIDDCTTCMKNIWVAVNDYILDTNQDFNGDMKMLRSATKPGTKNTYLSEEKYCPDCKAKKSNISSMASTLPKWSKAKPNIIQASWSFAPNWEPSPNTSWTRPSTTT